MPPVNNKQVIEAGIKKAEIIKNKTVIAMLIYAADKAIGIVASTKKHPYDNYTFNLEQSLAYAVYFGGRIVKMRANERNWSVANPEKYEPWGAYPLDRIHDDGADDAIRFLESYSSESPFEIVIIAGAEYAINVEEHWEEEGDPIRVLWGAFTFLSMNTVKTAKKFKIK